MNVAIDYLPEFERRAKALAKKYKSFPADYDAFLDELQENPFGGDPLGHNTYKHRMVIAAKGKGKSGGARVITYNVQQQTANEVLVTLMSIYDKSEINSVSDAFLRQLVAEVENKVK